MRARIRSITLLLCLLAGSVLAETTAIVGATVHTMGPMGTIEDATLVIEEGRFTYAGAAIAPPDDATVIDASGKIVTPGIFSPLGYLGLVEVGLSAGPLDAVQRGDRFTAGFDVADAYNPRSTLIAINRIEGVTRALIVPRATTPDELGYTSHVISGLAAAINLGDGDGNIDRRGAALVVNLGEGGSNYAGESRAAALLVVRDALEQAADYVANRNRFRMSQPSGYTYSIADLRSLAGVLDNSRPLLAHVHRASDIEALVRLCREFDIRCIVSGGAEAWLIADKLAAADIAVIIGPTANLPSNFDRLNASLQSAAVLHAAGVAIAFSDGRNHTHNARNVTQDAGNAVAEGLPYEAALHAITLAPAEMFGVAGQAGSIEAGKAADLVIWPGDPLEVTNFAERVMINGVDIPMVSRQTLLRDRYLKQTVTPPAMRR